jgi:two-component system phosphate regulon sensor histidine kinase PhoR
MVDELLDLATIEAGETPLSLAATDLGAVVIETLERLRGYADHHDVRLRADVPGDVDARTVPADASRIGQILVNVIDNAIRFSPAGGEVVVHVRPAAAEIVIEVADQGEGIAHVDLERVFERFYKGDRARSRGRGGTGLGLAIARHIAERHGGRMWAKSEPGKGAQLFLTLPREANAG